MQKLQLELGALIAAYPVLHTADCYAQFPLVTLKDLGARTSEQARKTHLCYRESFGAGHRTIAGLWLPLAAIDAVRIAAALVKVKADEARATVLLEQIAYSVLLVEKKEAAREKALASIVQQFVKATKLDADYIRATLLGLVPHVFSDTRATKSHFFPWVVSSLLKALGLTTTSYGSDYSSARGYPTSVEISGQQCQLLVAVHCSADCLTAALKQDKELLLRKIETVRVTLESQANSLLETWRALSPSWLSLDSLAQWCCKSVALQYAKQKPTDKDSHPLLACALLIPSANRPVVTQTWAFRWNNQKFSYAGCALTLAQLLGERSLQDPLKPAQEALTAILQEKAQEFIARVHQSFLQKHPFTVEHARWGFTQDSWNHWLAGVLAKAKVSDLSEKIFNESITSIYNNALVEYRKLLAARRCKEDMPTSIIDLYPIARQLQRRITFIHGPTNSGKTYHALEILKSATSGVYLGPLRLLALEVFETMNLAGIHTDLVTGELTQRTPGAQHAASTIEMLDLRKSVDVAVIDEAQMLGDPDRGSAWLQAILGAPARHLVVLGSSAALAAIRDLALLTGEPLTVLSKTRLNPLTVLDRPTSLKDVAAGTALIVFSRKDALGLTAHLRSSGKRVSVIYGALSPEVRTEQARQFRSGETDILVSTDAIGMGLNLPVHTVLFTTQWKFDGKAQVTIPAPLLQQIAGRAGRYGLENCGYVGALDAGALKYIKSHYSAPLPEVHAPFRFGLTAELADSIARNIETEDLTKVFNFFKAQIKLETWVLNSVTDDQLTLANWLDQHCPLPLAVRLMLSSAPALHKDSIDPFYVQMVRMINGHSGSVAALLASLPFTENRDGGHTIDSSALEYLEGRVRSLTLYCWMQQRFPAVLTEENLARDRLKQANTLVTAALQKTASRRCGSCSKPLPWNHAFNICEGCHQSRRQDHWDDYRH